VLAEELVVLDTDASLWKTARPLLDIALRLEHSDEDYSWHGWQKKSIDAFLKGLPAHCTLLVGVWEVGEVGEAPADQQDMQECETLVLGCVCEVIDGEIGSIRTFETLNDPSLPPVEQLEPGYHHALELMRVAKTQVAPVAWALFTDKVTWNEWVFADSTDGSEVDKGELLASFARQGRCVLMGSQTAHHHIHHR